MQHAMRQLAAAIMAGSALCALEPAAGQGMEGGLEEVLFDLDFNDSSTVVSPAIDEAWVAANCVWVRTHALSTDGFGARQPRAVAAIKAPCCSIVHG
jgi:hypothetical protein